MSDIALSLKNVSKKFPIYDSPLQRLREAVHWKRKKFHREFWALRDITLELETGVTMGVLGQNGSGKTTILQLMAGIMAPTRGEIEIRGRVATILELGAGFNPEFTGRENALLSGMILGLSPGEIRRKIGGIIAFAEIGEFIDQPVKTYSNGMYVRLAFAVAIAVDPDILLIDEILAVGDSYFQHKCVSKIRDFQDMGKTLVYVTHDAESVRNICHRAMILDYSRLIGLGEPGEIAAQYLALIDTRARDRSADIGSSPGAWTPADYNRYGSKEAEITAVEIFDDDGNPRTVFNYGENFHLRFRVVFHADVDRFVLGNIFRNHYGYNVFGTNGYWRGLPLLDFREGQEGQVTFHHRANLADGTYSINPAASAVLGRRSYRTLDWINNAAIIKINNPQPMDGYVSIPTRIETEKVESVSETGTGRESADHRPGERGSGDNKGEPTSG
ncbi:MAG: ABC transporter ATP-binding protein [Candidatus Erginobacter occultus]|nr:ABC transporter ATP-binding protein [Candidatus Erginobacter occultus]